MKYLLAVLLMVGTAYSLQVTLVPDSEGDSSGWTPNPSGEHYANIDDASETDYLYQPLETDRDDLFGISYPEELSSALIDSVTVFARAYKAGQATAVGCDLSLLVRSGGITDAKLGASDLTASTATYSQTWMTDPYDGQAWTAQDIHLLEIGIRGNRHRSGGKHRQPYVTQMWAIVDYTDGTQPTIILHTHDMVSTSPATFIFEAWGQSQLTCSLVMDGEQVVSMQPSGISNFTFEFPGNETIWQISCIDMEGNTNVSESWVATLNHPPVVVSSPVEPVEMKAGSESHISCNGTALDDGAFTINATAYLIGMEDTPLNLSKHIGSLCESDIIGGILKYNCSIDLPYYALPGEWQFKVVVADQYGGSEVSYQAFTVPQLAAIEFTTDMIMLDTGSSLTIRNMGNVILDIDSYAYSYDDMDAAMVCDYGRILHEDLRFSIGESEFEDMYPVGSIGLPKKAIDLHISDEHVNASRQIHYGMRIPDQAGGVCRGLMHFDAKILSNP